MGESSSFRRLEFGAPVSVRQSARGQSGTGRAVGKRQKRIVVRHAAHVEAASGHHVSTAGLHGHVDREGALSLGRKGKVVSSVGFAFVCVSLQCGGRANLCLPFVVLITGRRKGRGISRVSDFNAGGLDSGKCFYDTYCVMEWSVSDLGLGLGQIVYLSDSIANQVLACSI